MRVHIRILWMWIAGFASGVWFFDHSPVHGGSSALGYIYPADERASRAGWTRKNNFRAVVGGRLQRSAAQKWNCRRFQAFAALFGLGAPQCAGSHEILCQKFRSAEEKERESTLAQLVWHNDLLRSCSIGRHFYDRIYAGPSAAVVRNSSIGCDSSDVREGI